jgi:hypothetical protein
MTPHTISMDARRIERRRHVAQNPLRRLAAASITATSALIAVLAGTGCTDFFTEPAPAAPARLAVSFTMQADSALADAAALGAVYDKADNVRVLVLRGTVVLVDTVAPLASTAETSVRIDLDTQRDSVAVRILVEVLRGSDALFTGESAAVIVANALATVVVPLAPVVSGVRILTRPVADLPSVGATVQLTATATFATGDPLPGVSIQWASSNPAIIEVSGTGLATARGDGTAEVFSSYAGFTDTVTVRVRRVAASMELTPAAATIGIGQSRQFAVVLRDAGGTPMTGQALTWTSSNPAAASVHANGLVIGQAAGNASITASHESLARSATVTIVRVASIALLPAGVAFDVDRNVPGDPPPRSVIILNYGEGLLAGLSLGPVQYQGSETGWLQATLSGSAAPATITLRVTTADLPVGSYGAMIPVLSTTALNSPQTLVVTLNITGIVPMAPDTIGYEFGYSEDGLFHVWLFWQESEGATYYIIERSSPEAGWSELGRTEQEETEFETTATAGSAYYYRVRACNANGCSPPSPALYLEFPGQPADRQPAAPPPEAEARADQPANASAR